MGILQPYCLFARLRWRKPIDVFFKTPQVNLTTVSLHYSFRSERKQGNCEYQLLKSWYDFTRDLNPGLLPAKRPSNHYTTAPNKQLMIMSEISKFCLLHIILINGKKHLSLRVCFTPFGKLDSAANCQFKKVIKLSMIPEQNNTHVLL